LYRTEGDQNTGLGFFAGSNLNDDGTNNIYIGNVGPDPIGTESNTIRLGTQTATVATEPGQTYPMPAHTATFIAGISGTPVVGDPVVVDGNGQLGVAPTGSPLSANELLKQQCVVQELKATTERQAAVIALQEGQIKALTAGLQKVSAQLEASKPAPEVVNNP
jgi:hypothetical protein